MSFAPSGELDHRLQEILFIPGNNQCADCQAPDPEWSSINLGILLCIHCAGCHRSLGTHISVVKSLKLDAWADSQTEVGQHNQFIFRLSVKLVTSQPINLGKSISPVDMIVQLPMILIFIGNNG